ncbi:MAG: hypothetical protein L6U16_04200 [Porphyromonadaceae bacterium]|nr:MAG: hypothetical protein L6U16_04200 [Porphyromonadaceae bacterium]
MMKKMGMWKKIHDVHQKTGAFGVAKHHQYDGDTFTNGDYIVAHSDSFTTTNLRQWHHFRKFRLPRRIFLE